MATHYDFSVAVIDDDESFCRSVRRWLHAATFRAAIYRSAEAFLADPDNSRFTCLLVDVQLGGMSGLEMQRQLVARGSRTPVIFVTAYDDPAAIAEAREIGCVAFLRKTVGGARLLETIQSVLPGQSGTRVLPPPLEFDA
jgi:FixJ family two-component response regulator